MKFSEWKPIYMEIARDFSFDVRADEESARKLDSLLGEPSGALRSLEGVRGGAVTVLGPAATPSAMAEAPEPLFVADYAAARLPAARRPLAVVTDLDGSMERIAELSERGAVAIVHAHGDNIIRLDGVKLFAGPVLGTCQCAPVGRLRNYGGFTDGDRAAFLAEAFGAASVDLVGFDFDNPVPKPGRDPDMKRRKLAWARRLLGCVGIPVTLGGKPLV
jgi:hypothetical protein